MKLKVVAFIQVLLLSGLVHAQMSIPINKNYIRCEGLEKGVAFKLDIDLKEKQAAYIPETAKSEDDIEMTYGNISKKSSSSYYFSTEDTCSIDGLVFSINTRSMKIKLHREDFWSGEESTDGTEFTNVKCFYSVM